MRQSCKCFPLESKILTLTEHSFVKRLLSPNLELDGGKHSTWEKNVPATSN